MPDEEGTVQEQEAPSADSFEGTFGGTPSISEDAEEATPETDSTPEIDWETVDIETLDTDTLPEGMRQVAEAAKRRVNKIQGGVSQKMGEVNQYEQRLKELEEQRTAEPQAPEVPVSHALAEKMGVDRNSTNLAQQAALRSFDTVTEMVSNHPEIEALKAEMAELRQQAGMASEFVTAQNDTAYEQEYNSAIEVHGQATTDLVMDKYADMVGREGLNGQPLTVESLVAQMTGKAVTAGNEISAQAKAAKQRELQTASGVTSTSGLTSSDPALTDAEFDKAWDKT